jgi:hypothetical protein
MNRYAVSLSILTFSVFAASVVTACSDDNGTTVAPPYDGGTKPVATTQPEAAPSNVGDATVTPDAETAFDAVVESDTTIATDASDAASQTYALFVGTDYKTSELSVVGLNPPAILGRLPFASGDSVAAASNGRGFVLERDLGKIAVLDKTQPWKIATRIDSNDSTDAANYASNPQAVVVTTENRTYVARYSSNRIKILDSATGASKGEIDLAAFAIADDPDGLIEVADASYDSATGRIYFLLQRIDVFEFPKSVPDGAGKCLQRNGAIVAVDAKTDAVIDLNGAAAGDAIDLRSANPAALTADFANKRILLMGTGCYRPTDGGADSGPSVGPREGRGIESVNLTDGTTSWLYETTDEESLSGLVVADAIHAFVQKGGTWFAWNPTQRALGAAVAFFPKAPLSDGAGHVVGLALTPAAPDGGADAGDTWSVVSWNVATGTVAPVASGDPFQSVRPNASYGLTSALVH